MRPQRRPGPGTSRAGKRWIKENGSRPWKRFSNDKRGLRNEGSGAHRNDGNQDAPPQDCREEEKEAPEPAGNRNLETHSVPACHKWKTEMNGAGPVEAEDRAWLRGLWLYIIEGYVIKRIGNQPQLKRRNNS